MWCLLYWRWHVESNKVLTKLENDERSYPCVKYIPAVIDQDSSLVDCHKPSKRAVAQPMVEDRAAASGLDQAMDDREAVA